MFGNKYISLQFFIWFNMVKNWFMVLNHLIIALKYQEMPQSFAQSPFGILPNGLFLLGGLW